MFVVSYMKLPYRGKYFSNGANFSHCTNFQVFHGQVSFPKNVIRTMKILLYNQFKVLWVFDFLHVLGMLQQPWYTNVLTFRSSALFLCCGCTKR